MGHNMLKFVSSGENTAPEMPSDPDLRRTIWGNVWRRSRDIHNGRAVMAWAAIAGWSVVIYLLVIQ